jgi:aminoglycoside 3-N-acetyltransferase
MIASELSTAQIVDQLRALGVEQGDVLLVHTSFRAIRPIEGGPVGLIAALRDALGPNGTLVMPSWTGSDDEPFDPAKTPASSDLGIVTDMFWRIPGVLRSNHPFAMAAMGTAADFITSDPLRFPIHGRETPVARVHERDGKVLLLGVDHDADTMIHLAELIAEVPYRVPKHITVLKEDKPTRIEYLENDHCCQRFNLANEWLRARGFQSEGRVGHAHARLIRSRDIVDVVLDQLRRDPLIFLHPPSTGCVECDEARRTVTGH